MKAGLHAHRRNAKKSYAQKVQVTATHIATRARKDGAMITGRRKHVLPAKSRHVEIVRRMTRTATSSARVASSNLEKSFILLISSMCYCLLLVIFE